VDVLQGLVTRSPEARTGEDLPSGPADDAAAASLPESTRTEAVPVAEPDQPATPKADNGAQPSDPVTQPAAGKVAIEVSDKPVEAAPATAGAEADPVWMEKAAGLRVGCWVEMARDNGRLRCKLAAIIRATGKYIFVNRNGAKVAEYLQGELALALSESKITMLDDGLIFDRALESIIDNLRHNRRD
jgi:hypothetical protein